MSVTGLCHKALCGSLCEVSPWVSLCILSVTGPCEQSLCHLCAGLSVWGSPWLPLPHLMGGEGQRDLLLPVSCCSISIPIYLWHLS